MFFQYPLTKGFKERALAYGTIMAVITLIFHIFSIILGHGLQTYFDTPIGSDFIAFYTGGSFFNLGNLEKIYEFAPEMYFPTQFEFQKQIIGPDYMGHSPFINPPFAVIIYAPFALLDYIPAYICWLIFNLSLLGLCVRTIHKELPIYKNTPFYKLFLCCFLFFPTIASFMFGQATPIILLCYCLCFVSLRKKQDFRAGFYLGLLAFKPQLAIAVALILIFKWRWKSLLGGMLSLSLSLGVGFLYMPDAMHAYLTVSPQLLDFLRSSVYPIQGVDSFFGFSVLLFNNINPSLAITSTFVLTGITILFLLSLWRKIDWLENKVHWDLAMAVTFCWGLLISPHLFYYDLMLLLLPAAILVQHLPWLYLRNNKILLWTTVLWTVSYLGSFISDAQVNILSYFNLMEIGFQLATPTIFYWGYCIYKATLDEQRQRTFSPTQELLVQ